MNAGAKLLHSLVIAGVLLLAGAGAARAASNPATCTNDVDCVATPACGGDVCDYNAAMTCKPAGTAAKGSDGWCTVDTDCKCMGQGAKCTAPYCTFTKASDAPASGAAGSTGTAGSGAGGTTGAAGSGTDGGTKPASSSGCSVASSTSGGFGALVGLALVVGRLVRRRRRA
jgi:MYXO-CTERM domain-containing protein